MFTLISVLYPLITSWLLINSTDNQTISLHNINFIFSFSSENKLIGLALLIVTLVANLYAISQNRQHEVIIGSIYSVASLICLLAGDLISMFLALEFMIICAAILIFYGGHIDSSRAARQYFLTHLFSGGLILIGVVSIIAKTGNTQIVLLTQQFFHDKFSIIFILTGCLINVAAVPFSGWMVNCYPASSSSALIYLISFTSKVSLMILIKLFSGLEILKSVGILMILYGGGFALIENNLKRLLCYLTISQIGFILIAIGENSQQATFGIIAFLFIHIIYKALFALYIAMLNDKRSIDNFSEITNFHLLKHPLFSSSLILIILTMVSLPWLASFSTKIAITSILNGDINHYMIILLKYLTCVVMFSFGFKNFKIAMGSQSNVILKERSDLKKPALFLKKKNESSLRTSALLRTTPKFQNNASSLSLFLILAVTSVTSIFLPEILVIIWPSYPLEILEIEPHDSLKQFIIILLGVISAGALKRLPRYSTANINLDLFRLIEHSYYSLQSKYKEKSLVADVVIEASTLDILEKTALHKLKSLHNQSASIFTIFSLLISLITILNS